MSTSTRKSSSIDRSAAPAAGEPRPYSFPEVTSFRLENGLRVLSAALPEFPLAAAQILVPAGGLVNPIDRPGLADLHGALLQEGTKSFTSSELALEVEQLGGSLETGAGWNAAYCDISLLSSSFDSGLELLAEMMLHATLDEEKFQWLKERTLADLMRRPSKVRLLADDVFSKVVYGDSVYGFPIRGTMEAIGALEVEEVRDFHRRYVVPEGSTLVVAGDYDLDHLHRRVEELLGDWETRAYEAPPKIEPTAREGIEIHIVDRDVAAQTQIHVGHASVDRRNPEFYRLIVLNMLLGGKFTSRLNLNLRERHGFTYSVQSSFARRLGPGPFNIRTAVATDVAGAATREILFELRRLREEPIPEEETRETIDYLTGVFPYTAQSTDDILGRLENIAVFELPLDYYDRFHRQIRELTSKELEDAARAYIHPEQLVVVVAGPAAELRPQFEELGPVHVHSVKS